MALAVPPSWIHDVPFVGMENHYYGRQIRLLCQKHVQNSEEESDTTEAAGVKAFLTSGGLLQLKTLVDGLTPQNCLEIRQFSIQFERLSKITESCDAFISANLSRMLSEDQLICLPRVQVNVDVSAHLEECETRSLDCDVLEQVVAAVVRELSAHCEASLTPCQFVEEKLVMMELLSDRSVQMARSEELKKSLLSHEDTLVLKQSTPVQKRLRDAETKTRGCVSGGWEILATHAIGTGAMSIVKCANKLLVLNVQMVSINAVICPISPTTGVPLAASDAFFSQMVQSRSGFGLTTVEGTLMSVGGFSRGGVIQNCERFDLKANTWAPSCDLTTPRARLVVVQHESEIYALGGSDGKADLNSVEMFSCEGKGWKRLPSTMGTARSDFGAVVVGGCIYAVGGAHYSRPLRSAEVFNPAKGEWKKIAFMTTPRRGVAIASCNDSVYAIGGQASSWGCLNSVECYNPITNQWRKVAPMSMPRRNACAIAIEDRIYVIGGYNGSSTVNVVEVYDPAIDKWTSICPMALKRSHAAAVLLEDDIYVVGGFSGSIFLN